MSDFLTTLAARTLGVVRVVAPRRPSRFEGDVAGESLEPTRETPGPRAASAVRSPSAAPEPSLTKIGPHPDRAPPPLETPDFENNRPSPSPTRIDLASEPPPAGAAAVPGESPAEAPSDGGVARAVVRPARSRRESQTAEPAASRRQPATQRLSEPAPAIHITIGRVDVRAIYRPDPTPASRPAPANPRLSLGSYLRGRRE